MKRLLVLGGSGFLGKHLTAMAQDWEVEAPSSRELNLFDLDATRHALTHGRFDAVIHAAGFVGGIGLNKAHPGRMISENLRMGMNLVEAQKATPDTHLVIVSTVCAYAADAPVPTPESCLLEGVPAADTLPYGLAKRTLFVAADAVHREFGTKFTYIVPTNLYGPGDHFEESKSHVVPALIRRAHELKESGAEEMLVWGDGTQTRDLLYVQDAARALLTVAGAQPTQQAYNLSSNRETSVRELAEAIAEKVGFKGRLVFDATKPGGAPKRALDGTKAKETFGISPSVSLEEGIAETYQWFLKHQPVHA